MARICNFTRAVSMTVLLFFAVSCFFSPSVSEQLTSIIEEVEYSDVITDEEWIGILEEYNTIVDEFNENLDLYTEEEKQEVYKLIGKMNGIIAKREAEKAVGRLNDVIESLPSMLDGFVEGITGGE